MKATLFCKWGFDGSSGDSLYSDLMKILTLTSDPFISTITQPSRKKKREIVTELNKYIIVNTPASELSLESLTDLSATSSDEVTSGTDED